MKKIFIGVLIITFLAGLSIFSGTMSVDKLKKEVSTVLDDSEKGWNEGNIEKYMECYHRSDKMRFAGNESFNFGWENTLKRYKKSYPDKKAMGKLTFSDVDITILSNDAAYIFGRWTLHYPDKKRTGLYTLIMRKFKEGWRIIHDHSSSAK